MINQPTEFLYPVDRKPDGPCTDIKRIMLNTRHQLNIFIMTTRGFLFLLWITIPVRVFSFSFPIRESGADGSAEIVKLILLHIIPLLVIIFIGFLWLLSIRISVVRKTRELRSLTNDLNGKISELERERELIQTTLHSIGDAVISMNSDGVIRQINPSALRILELEGTAVVGRSFPDVFGLKETGGGDRKEVSVTDCCSICDIPEGLLTRKDNGKAIEISYTLSPIILADGNLYGSILVFRDISSELRLQRQLQEKSKMEVIGQLAGGIAHDFNNQLSGILGYGELILRQNIDSKVEKYAGVIVKNAQKSSLLVNKLLSFARKGKIAHERFDIHTLIPEILKAEDIPGKSQIGIETRLTAEHSFIKGDPLQMHNALAHILQNGADALANRKDHGKILIETASEYSDIHKRILLRICITDNGEGMTEDVQMRILEPFFTTKSRVKGSGMGLAAAHGIIVSHQGEIRFESEPGKGTRVSVTLPAAE